MRILRSTKYVFGTGAACMASLLWVVAEREERLPPNLIPEQDED